MLRVFLGLLKGGLVGAGIGFLAWKAGVTAGVAAIIAYGLVGGLVGVVAGRPPWRQETIWTSLLKGLFGFGVGLALYFGAHKLLGGMHLAFATGLGAPDKPFVEVPFLLGPVIGAIWGILVEVDDGAGKNGKAAGKAAAPAGSAQARK
jgi:hypothetical protein